MRIAVIGSGISGLACAHALAREHEVVVYEARDRVGGHTHTVDVDVDGRTIPVDTGFIVFNEQNYPLFVRLLDELAIPSAPTKMTFAVRDDPAGLEYGGGTLAGLFAQKRNLARPSFWGLLRDIKRFGPMALEAADGRFRDATLGEFLDSTDLGATFRERFLKPMAAAIWSAPAEEIERFPLRGFVAFFDAHGMLTPWKAPRWRYVKGGSRQYVRAICERLGDRVRVDAPVASVRRSVTGVEIETRDGDTDWFEEVVIAAHSNQALAMLDQPTDEEREILGAIPYRPNDVVLHTDASLMPRRRSAWCAWNYLAMREHAAAGVSVTYCMNILQDLPTDTPMLVTLNSTDRIDPSRILRRFTYDHPVYTRATFDAQQRWSEISGQNRTHYCGAYWGYGFHEDGMRSAHRVLDAIGAVA